MNIEEAIEKFKCWIEYEKVNKEKNNRADELIEIQETILSAYEKEENVKLRLQNIPLIEGELRAYKDRVNELKIELEKEKEKNKELESDIEQKNFEIKCLKKEHKEKIIYWLDRLDLEEELQNEYDELYGCQAVVKMLKQLLKEE